MNNKPYSKEAKSEKFIRIAQQRTNKVLNSFRLLRNTANRNSYFYTDEQVVKIFSAIEVALLETRNKFRRNHIDKFEL